MCRVRRTQRGSATGLAKNWRSRICGRRRIPRFRLFMVLLPGAPSPVDPRLAFLRTRTWVDLRPESGGGGFDDLLTAATGVPRVPRDSAPGRHRLPVPGPRAVRRAPRGPVLRSRGRRASDGRDAARHALHGRRWSVGKRQELSREGGPDPGAPKRPPSRQLGVADPHDDARRPSARCSRCAARASGRDPFDAAHARRARDRRAHRWTSALRWRRVGRPARIGCSSSSTSSRRSSRSAATSQSARPSLRTFPMRPRPGRSHGRRRHAARRLLLPVCALPRSCGASSQVSRC